MSSTANNSFLFLPSLAKLVISHRNPLRISKNVACYLNLLESKGTCLNISSLSYHQCCKMRNPVNLRKRELSISLRNLSLSSFNGDRRRPNGNELGETSIMRQEGLEIQEVPLAVLKRSDCETTEESETKKKLETPKSYIDLDPREEKAFIEGFSSYNSPQEVLKMLDTIPSQEVTPFVSLSILKKLFQLENNFLFRNDGKSWVISAENSIIETFARTAIVTRLIDTIVSSEKSDVILSALDVLRCEKIHENAQNSDGGSSYRNRIFEEVLLRVTQGKLTLNQVCQAVVGLGKMETERGMAFQHDLIDKLWIGISEKSYDISPNNIVEVFRVIQYFKKSRRLVLNLAEKKFLSLWWKMDCKIVSEICGILIAEDKNAHSTSNTENFIADSWGITSRLLLALSRCASLNIHHVQEDELLKIVKAFHLLDFCDESIEKALNKYMKAKCLKVSNANLIAIILDYTKKFRIRSANILEAAAEFVVLHQGQNLSPPQLTSIVTAFGHLDFQPPNGLRFWQTVESYMDKKFIQFRPKDAVDVLLSCVYLLKYPINFVDRVFSPYFLDRVHTNEPNYNLLQDLRTRLKLLDSSLTIECPAKYGGPKLPKDFTSRSVFVDGRVLRMSNFISDILKEILESSSSVQSNLILPNLPLNSLYIVDLIISSMKVQDFNRDSYFRNRIAARLNTGVTSSDNPRNLTVCLIHIPEHFSKGGQHLIGSQAMRIRHLKTLGFNVATLSYDTLSELKVHPDGLNNYLKERISLAGFPIS